MRLPDRPRDSDPIGTGGDVAIDIEAINLVDPPDLDFESPEHWTVFAVALGHRPSGSHTIETDVIERRGPTLCDEFEALEATAQWIQDRDPDRIVTYNGRSYDLPILRHRSERSAHECPGDHSLDFELVFARIEHIDLFEAVKSKNGGEYTSLDDALAQHGITVEVAQLAGEPLTGADMPEIGKRILLGEASIVEQQAFQDYARSDVRPLFDLLDAVSDNP